MFQRKIFVKNVLKKNGLWFNAQEVILETYELEPHLARYRKALAHLKKALIANKVIDSPGKKEVVSGFAYRKKLRYHAIKKMKCIDGKPWKKERKDFGT